MSGVAVKFDLNGTPCRWCGKPIEVLDGYQNGKAWRSIVQCTGCGEEYAIDTHAEGGKEGGA